MRCFFSVEVRISLLLLILLGKLSNVNAQAISVNPAVLNFGIITEAHADSLQITLTNQLNRTVNITGMRFYTTYGQNAFSASQTTGAIPAGGQMSVWIRFAPRHNIFHNSELIIENDGLRGYSRVDLTGQGRYSRAYYDLTENKSEEALKLAIQQVTGNGYIALGYNIARDSMFMIIDNKRVNGEGAAQNTLESVYTGALAVGYIDRVDAQNNFAFNTEHTFPQSLFASLEPMKSDLFHLFPCDDLSNTRRGDNPFGIVTNPTWTSGGSKSTNTLFEPRDQVKGMIARTMFYFTLRYQNYNSFLTNQEAVLRNWFTAYPPTVIERTRNEKISTMQMNRNPFIDYPQFLERISSVSLFSQASPTLSLNLSQDSMILGTVAPASTVNYKYIVVNNGNTNISLSNFSLSHPGIFSFAGSSSDTLLSPGEALQLDISCSPLNTDSVRGWLSFNSNVPGRAQVAVPVFMNDRILTSANEPSGLFFHLYPNPASTHINIRTDEVNASDAMLTIRDMRGRIVFQQYAGIQQDDYTVWLGALAEGLYSVEINGVQHSYRQLLLIQR